MPAPIVSTTRINSALQQQMMIIISDIAKKCKDKFKNPECKDEEGEDSILEFSKVNTAEYMPEVCNEFVTIFLEQREEYIDRGDAIDLTLNFCSWLYKKGHTCIKLSMKNYS